MFPRHDHADGEFSLSRCREILGDIAPESDEQLARIRDDLAALADIAVNVTLSMAPLDPSFSQLVGADARDEHSTDVVSTDVDTVIALQPLASNSTANVRETESESGNSVNATDTGGCHNDGNSSARHDGDAT